MWAIALLAAALPARGAALPPEADVSTEAVTRAIERIEGFEFPIDIKRRGSPEERRLGRDLFFDPRLSGDKTMSCSTCHHPKRAFTDGRVRARGHGGVDLPRNVPSLYNVNVANPSIHGFFLDGRAASIEDVALSVIQEPRELDNTLPALLATLGRDRGYARRFREVYGKGGLTAPNAAKAIAVYVRSLAPAGTSAFDRALDDPSALSPAQKRGLLLFVGKARCVDCHEKPDLTSGQFFSTGLKPTPGVEDSGRYAVTRSSADWRVFKIPSLRNVALTAPYMHDGSLKTLADVVEFYDRGGDHQPNQYPKIEPLHLTASEKSDLVAFLYSLTNGPAVAPAPSEDLAPSTAPAQLSRYWDLRRQIDGDLDKAGALIDRAEALSAPWTSLGDYRGRRCLTRFSPASLVDDEAAYRFDPQEERFLETYVSQDLLDYFEYRAFAEKDPRLCDELERQSMGESPYEGRLKCRSWYAERTLLAAMLGSTDDFPRVCREAASLDEHARADAEAVCGILGAHLDDPQAACEPLVPRFLSKNWVRECRSVFRPLTGAPADCAAFDFLPSAQDLCLTVNSFARAARGRDASLCAGQEACLTLMGQGEAVAARVADRLKARVCRSGASAKDAAESARGAVSLLDQAQRWLEESATDGAVSAPKEASQDLKKVAFLRARARRLLR